MIIRIHQYGTPGPYAVQQALKRPTALLFAINTLLMAPSLFAADNNIEELIINGARLEETIPQDLSRYGNQVEVITGEQILRMGFVDVSQTLQMLVPGLHIRPKNGPFDYVDASLQGSRTGDILWLIDGVRINNRLYNGTTPLDTIPAHMIERIEVLKGGQGIFYGTQSVGGVINVVTRSLQQDADGNIGTSINTNSGYGVNGYYRAGTERFHYAVYASRDESDGYQPYRDRDIQPSASDTDRGYEVDMVGVKLGFAPTTDSLLSMHYQRTEGELDFAQPFLNYNTFNEREEDILTLKYDLQVNDNLGLFVKAYRHNWDTFYTRIYNTLDASGKVTGAMRYVNNADFWGYQDDGLNAMAKLNTSHGLEYVVGYDRQEFSGTDDVYRIGDLEESVDAGFLQVRTNEDLFDNTMFAIGVRYNSPDNTQSKTVWNFSGKHNFSDNLYVQANIGTSFRLPDAEQLFVAEIHDENNDGVPDDYFTIGNPDLKPEESRNINIGLGGNAGIFTYELTGFRRDITDYIEGYVTTYVAGVEGESFFNTSDEVNIRGAELRTTAQLTPELFATLSYTDTEAELNDNGTQLVGIPENEAKLQLSYQSQALPWGVTLALDHVGTLNERRGQVRGNYTVADLSGFYAFGTDQQHNLALRIENIADKVYATRVARGTTDTGTGYDFDNLGMERTLHASYNFRF